MVIHTFVIPVYKESPYLEFCITNLQKQTVKSTIIITTSTPTEQTRRIAKKYNINYYTYKGEKTGIGNDWNFALSKVKTMYATIAHQDDIYEPTYTESVIKEQKSTLIFTDYYDLIGTKKRLFSLNYAVKKILLFPFLFKRTYSSYFFKKSILLFGDPICCPSVTFNLKNINNINLFSPNYKCALDWVTWLKLAKEKGSFTYINKRLVQHRIHQDSETTISLNSGVRKEEELKIFKSIWGSSMAKCLSFLYSIGHKDNDI